MNDVSFFLLFLQQFVKSKHRVWVSRNVYSYFFGLRTLLLVLAIIFLRSGEIDVNTIDPFLYKAIDMSV